MVATLVVLLGTSIVSALVPLMNAELLVLSAAAVLGPGFAVPVAVVASTGQMCGKAVLFQGGRGLRAASDGRNQRAAALALRFEGRPKTLLTACMASAVVGLPPFYLMSIVAGIARVSAAAFFVVGFVGRCARFYAIAVVPGLI